MEIPTPMNSAIKDKINRKGSNTFKIFNRWIKVAHLKRLAKNIFHYFTKTAGNTPFEEVAESTLMGSVINFVFICFTSDFLHNLN
ncbi:MAG: hypothetical protein ACR5K1_04715 [Wolbachia sp.]